MDSSLDGAAGDSSKCSEMSVDEKRQLVYDLSKQSHLASEVLQAWSRQEILQILCAEMGKERKYTGLTKVKIIDYLLKIVSEKNTDESDAKRDYTLPIQRNSKRQRKIDNPSRYVIQSRIASGSSNSVNTKGEEDTVYCNNLACKAIMKSEDLFCRRCSCCICRKYDDNKDPSLWLTCNSDAPYEGESCGLSCHLECAFKNEKSGLTKRVNNMAIEGCFYCISCGKTNSLIECWKKQLMIAMETRRVDVLCYRVFIVQKLLKDLTKYRKLCQVVDEAVKCLEADVGTLTGLNMKIGRGIVNRLQSGPEVQKLCAKALEILETIPHDAALQDTATTGSTKIRFEDIHATSLTVILGSNEVFAPSNIVHYSIWHRKVTDKEYPEKSTCTLFTPNTRFVISGLTPASEYCFKVVSFTGTKELGIDEINVSTRIAEEEGTNCSRSESPFTNCSTLSSTPSSLEAESNNDYIKNQDLDQNPAENAKIAKRVSLETDLETSQIEKTVPFEDLTVTEDEEVLPVKESSEIAIRGAETDVLTNRNSNSDASLPITPFRFDLIKNRQARSAKLGKSNGNCNGNNGNNGDGFEHCVKMIRELECLGHIEKNFRQKFLTWYSLRATDQEIKVVKIFIDTFSDDPIALAEQLVDTFSDRVSNKRLAIGNAAVAATSSAVVPGGFCMKLWH